MSVNACRNHGPFRPGHPLEESELGRAARYTLRIIAKLTRPAHVQSTRRVDAIWFRCNRHRVRKLHCIHSQGGRPSIRQRGHHEIGRAVVSLGQHQHSRRAHTSSISTGSGGAPRSATNTHNSPNRTFRASAAACWRLQARERLVRRHRQPGDVRVAGVTDSDRWAYLAEGNAKQARKRVAADVLLGDDAGRVLLVNPTYKEHWDLPGGMVEANRAAAVRELRENWA
jgi:hypothetical protein